MFEEEFPVETPGEQAKLIEIWTCFLTWDVLVVGLNVKDVAFYPYHLQLFSHQFGLSQLKPYPIMKKLPNLEDFVVTEDNWWNNFYSKEFITAPRNSIIGGTTSIRKGPFHLRIALKS